MYIPPFDDDSHGLSSSELEVRCAVILKNLGVYMPHSGSRYLVKAICEVYSNPSAAQYVTKTLVPTVGRLCHTSERHRVHRAMLRSARVLKIDPDTLMMKKYFGTETPKTDLASIVRGIAEYLHREDGTVNR